MTQAKKPTPRRSAVYDEAIAVRICERIAAGEGLREICEDKDVPSKTVVYRWLAAESQFRDAYARARELQMESWADELRDIATDGSNDWIVKINADGSTDRVLDHEHVQRSKLRIDTLKWLMSKFAPKRFADKVEVELSGTVKVETLSDVELEAKAALLLARLGIEAAGPLLIQAEEPEPRAEGIAVE